MKKRSTSVQMEIAFAKRQSDADLVGHFESVIRGPWWRFLSAEESNRAEACLIEIRERLASRPAVSR